MANTGTNAIFKNPLGFVCAAHDMRKNWIVINIVYKKYDGNQMYYFKGFIWSRKAVLAI